MSSFNASTTALTTASPSSSTLPSLSSPIAASIMSSTHAGGGGLRPRSASALTMELGSADDPDPTASPWPAGSAFHPQVAASAANTSMSTESLLLMNSLTDDDGISAEGSTNVPVGAGSSGPGLGASSSKPIVVRSNQGALSVSASSSYKLPVDHLLPSPSPLHNHHSSHPHPSFSSSSSSPFRSATATSGAEDPTLSFSPAAVVGDHHHFGNIRSRTLPAAGSSSGVASELGLGPSDVVVSPRLMGPGGNLESKAWAGRGTATVGGRMRVKNLSSPFAWTTATPGFAEDQIGMSQQQQQHPQGQQQQVMVGGSGGSRSRLPPLGPLPPLSGGGGGSGLAITSEELLVDPTSTVGGIDLGLTSAGGGGNIFGGVMPSSSSSVPQKVKSLVLNPVDTQTLEQQQQPVIRLTPSASAAAAAPLSLSVSPPSGLPSSVTPSLINVPRVVAAAEQQQQVPTSGVNISFDFPAGADSSATPVRLVPDPQASGVVSLLSSPPPTIPQVRLVPSQPRVSASAAQVRIVPDVKQRPKEGIRLVSVLNLPPQQQQQDLARPEQPPTVILKPMVQPARSQHQQQQVPAAIVTAVRVASSSSSAVTATTRRRRQGAAESAPAPSTSVAETTTAPVGDPRIQQISCFKCAQCGFLGLQASAVEEHCLLEHEERRREGGEGGASADGRLQQRRRRAADRGGQTASSSWLSLARQEGVKLRCPLCPNQFNAESSRSFKVHVTDDHGKEEDEADALYAECNERRRADTIEALRKRRKREREARKRANPGQHVALEAYVDDAGELRVRSCIDDGDKADDDESVDVSATDYMSAVDVMRQDSGEAREQESKLIKKLKAKQANGVDGEVAVPPVSAASQPPPPKRRRAGRPVGSRTIGITRLRRSNPSISVSDRRMGAECGVSDCAVRIRSEELLSLHRRSHADPDRPVGFVCLECRRQQDGDGSGEGEVRFEFWSQLAMHLWRRHKVDMELFSCAECERDKDKEGFRCFTQARLQSHLLSHRKAECLCQDCGKGFKTEKSLRAHRKTHDGGGNAGAAAASAGVNSTASKANTAKCDLCERTFRGQRRLQLHVASVHQKLRPHLCNFCGYAASNRSTLRLHLRALHTGEKPYACDAADCDYRSSDHNSLRRHKMRHSGEKPYKCPHCPYASIQCSTYKVHLRSKHPDLAQETVFQCTSCSFKTVKKGNFLAHRAEHHRRRDDDGEEEGGEQRQRGSKAGNVSAAAAAAAARPQASSSASPSSKKK